MVVVDKRRIFDSLDNGKLCLERRQIMADWDRERQRGQSDNGDDWDWYYYEYRYEPYYSGNVGDRERYGREYGQDYGRSYRGSGQDYGQSYGRNYRGYGQDYNRNYRRGYGPDYGQDYWPRYGRNYGQNYGCGYGNENDYGYYGNSSWNRGRYSGMVPRGYQRSDERITEDVNDRLTWHGQIDATDVRVDVNGGVVTLNGSVNSRRKKRMAEDIAESVSRVMDVQNNLIVNNQAGQNQGERRDANEPADTKSGRNN
jgi:hypothetical protein